MTLQHPARSSPRPSADAVVQANHYVANQLSMLVAIVQRQLPAIEAGPAQIPRDSVVKLLTDIAVKILAIGQLHRLLAMPAAPGEVDLADVVATAVDALKAPGMFDERLRVTSNLGSHRLDAGQASKLLLAFSEIAANALKYAHPTGLPVELGMVGRKTASGGYTLQIADDGVGFPEGFVEERDAGLGLGLVRSLVEEVGGSVEIKSDPLGLTFSIELRPERLQ